MDSKRSDDRNGKQRDILDWSQEVEQEESRKREGRNMYTDASFENGGRRRHRRYSDETLFIKL